MELVLAKRHQERQRLQRPSRCLYFERLQSGRVLSKSRFVSQWSARSVYRELQLQHWTKAILNCFRLRRKRPSCSTAGQPRPSGARVLPPTRDSPFSLTSTPAQVFAASSQVIGREASRKSVAVVRLMFCKAGAVACPTRTTSVRSRIHRQIRIPSGPFTYRPRI